MRVIAFNCSPRKNGNTARLIKTALDEVKREGIDTEIVQVGGENIHGCRACYRCRKSQDRRCSQDDDIANACIEKMIAADGILLGSPTYFADVTPEMKALIDRAGFVARMNGDLFRRKVGAAIIAVRRAGAIHAFDSINHFFMISQMIVPGSSYWNLGVGLKPDDVSKDEEGIQTMQTLGQNMAWLLKRILET
jgi:multimeric flavodoxin WrbA